MPFVVDTGATGTALFVEPWAAKKLHLQSSDAVKNDLLPGQGYKTMMDSVVETLQIVGVNKSSNITYTAKSNKKDDLKDSGFTAVVVDVLSPFSSFSKGPQPAGAIAAGLLSIPGCVFQIDFRQKSLTLIQKTKEWHPAVSAHVVPLTNAAKSEYASGFYVTLTLAEGDARKFLIDTGSPSTQMQSPAALPASSIRSAKELGDNTDRKCLHDVILLHQLQIGDLVEPDVSMHETSSLAIASSANIVGLDFLSRFVVTLDFRENKMYLERRPDYARKVVPPGQAGVRLEKRAGKYVAAWVELGSSAERAGMRAGDQIEQVDGEPLADIPRPAAQDLLDGSEGTTAKADVRDAQGRNAVISFVRSKKFFGRRHALLGVSLDWVQGHLMVSGMTPGGPLEHTLKWGDDFYFVNGVSVAKMTMDEAFQQLERPDMSLQVWRDMDKTWQELHIAPLPTQTQVLTGPLPAVNRYSFNATTGWTAAPL